MHRKFQDLTGMRFGRLTVIEESYKENGKVYWRCRCDCNEETIVQGSKLRGGQTKSCGCLFDEYMQDRIKYFYKDRVHQKLYKTWACMKQRCYNPHNASYNNYGGRGITVCQEWKDNFLNFYNWAINNHYNDKLIIERKNVNGNYDPTNCKWATAKEQQNNTRANVHIEYNGQIKNIKEWSEITGIPYYILQTRYSNGDMDERLFRPIRHKRKRKDF